MSSCSVHAVYGIRNFSYKSAQIEIFYQKDITMDSLILEKEIVPIRFSKIYTLSGRVPFQQVSQRRIIVNLPPKSTLIFAAEVNDLFGLVDEMRIILPDWSHVVNFSDKESTVLSGAHMKKSLRGNTVVWYDIGPSPDE